MTDAPNATSPAYGLSGLSDPAGLWESLLDHALVGIALTDPEGRWLYANSALCDMLSCTRGECIGRAIDEFISPADREHFLGELDAMRRGDIKQIQTAFRHPRHDGSVLHGKLKISPLGKAAAGAGYVVQLSDTSAQQQAELALEEAQRRWNQTLSGSRQVVWDFHVPTGMVEVSSQWQVMLDLPDEERVHHISRWLSRMHPDDQGRLFEATERVRVSGEREFDAYYRLRHQTQDRWIWVLSRGRVVEYAPDGSILRMIGTIIDVTHEKELEARLTATTERLTAQTRQLQETLALLEGVLRGTPDLIYVKDCAGRYVLVNPAVEQVMGRTADDIIGRLDTEIFPPDIAHALMQNDRQVLQTDRPYSIEETAVVDGNPRTYASTKAPLRDSEGRLIGILGISRDQTEAKLAELELRRSEARWQFALDGSGDGIWDWDMRSGHVFYSHQWKAMLGHAEEDIGSTVSEWSQRVHPDDVARCWDIIEAHLQGRSLDFVLEHRMRTRDGRWRWILDRGKVIERGTDGQPLRVIGTHTDITARKESEAAILALNERLQLALGVSGVGIWELPEVTGQSFTWDEPMHALYRMAPGTFSGRLQDWLERIHPEDRVALLKRWEDALGDAYAHAFDTEFRIQWPTGEVRHLRAQAQIFRAADGAPLRAIGVNRDITDERRAAEVLLHAKEAAESAGRAKSDFLAVMSHEIRTPMNTVLGMSRLALQTELAPKQRNYLGKVHASAENLLTIINNVLDYSKIEAGGLALEAADFTLSSVLDAVAAVTAMKAEEKGLEIAYTTTAGVPEHLVGDAFRLGQVLINLVSNAVKFTARGEVIVSVCLVDKLDGQRSRLRFEVRDTGIGLDAWQADRLFQAFNQAESATSRKYGGTGLGLVICRRLVELMGGSIGVRSKPGEGATFHFTIDVGVRQGLEAQPSAGRQPGLAGKRVLVTDDNASARSIFARMLRQFRMNVTTAASGQEAIEALKNAARDQRAFDLVLMDWRMPGLDGLEVARRIRADHELQQTPAVLMVTAYGREEVIHQVEQLQLDGLLIKPVTESTLLETVESIFAQRDSTDAPTRCVAPTDALTSAGAILGHCRGQRVLVVDDHALNREVASEFLLAAGLAVDVAPDGESALGRLASQHYDAMLLDIHMPGMDGLATAREIRRHARWAHLPIIALTALARPQDRAASMEAGMNAHLTKPLDAGMLYETLAKWMSPARQDGRGDVPVADDQAETAAVDSRLPHASSMDLRKALERMEGKHDMLLSVMRHFISDFGDASVRLDDYIQARRTTAVANLVHAVRGSAAYLHADALCIAAERLENAAWAGQVGDMYRHKAAFIRALALVMSELQQVLAEYPTVVASAHE